MGWWGSGVMDGDQPHDWADNIVRILELEGLYGEPEEWSPRVRAFVRICVNKFTVAKLCRWVSQVAQNPDDRCIGLMVVALVVVTVKADIDNKSYARFAAAFLREPWALEDKGRQRSLEPVWRDIVSLKIAQDSKKQKSEVLRHE